jgi:hypothetical protein
MEVAFALARINISVTWQRCKPKRSDIRNMAARPRSRHSPTVMPVIPG